MVLRVVNLSFKKEKRFLIRDLCAHFLPGNIYGILGPNGSGKTTFLKVISGLWKATTGEIFWQESSLFEKSRQEIARLLTYVSQSQAIPFDYPVHEIVAMGKYPHHQKQNNTEIPVMNALQMVDAAHLYNRPITELSHGERQRVNLAKALITETPILLLDEPTTNLDLRHQIDLWMLLKKLAEQGKTIIVSNHDIPSTIKYCNFVYIINKGQCASYGRPNETLTPDVLKDVFNIEDYRFEF